MIGKFILNMQDKSFNNEWGVKEDPIFDKLNRVTVGRLSQIESSSAKTNFLKFKPDLILELAKPFTSSKQMIEYKGENELEINAAGRYIENKVIQRPEWFVDIIKNKYSKKFVEQYIVDNKIKSRNELLNTNQPLYGAAKRYKLLDKYFPRYKKRKPKYSNEDLAKIALKYKTKIEFRRNNGSIYNAAYNRGILNDICSHMESNRGRPKK